jgi:GT2 family glycosyltransferase
MNPTYWLTFGNPIILSSVICRKKDLISIGGFDESISNCEDLDLWIRLHSHGVEFKYCRRVLCHYKIANNKLSGSTANIVKGTEHVLKKNSGAMSSKNLRLAHKYKCYLYGSSYLATRIHEKRAKVLLRTSIALLSAPRRALIAMVKLVFL